MPVVLTSRTEFSGKLRRAILKSSEAALRKANKTRRSGTNCLGACLTAKKR